MSEIMLVISHVTLFCVCVMCNDELNYHGYRMQQ